MAEHQGKTRERKNIPGGTPTDDEGEAGPDTPPRGEGADPEYAITRKKAKEANQENPNTPRGHRSKGGWTGRGAG